MITYGRNRREEERLRKIEKAEENIKKYLLIPY